MNFINISTGETKNFEKNQFIYGFIDKDGIWKKLVN